MQAPEMIGAETLSDLESLGPRINFKEKQDKSFYPVVDTRVGVYLCAVPHRCNYALRDDPANLLLLSGHLKTMDGRRKQIQTSATPFLSRMLFGMCGFKRPQAQVQMHSYAELQEGRWVCSVRSVLSFRGLPFYAAALIY